MWIFGYGSLVWKADFPYIKKVVGYVKGYERKFWQASVDHRGVPGKPGRVATLVPSSDHNARVWGTAYKIHSRDIDRVVNQLDLREQMGYVKIPIEFHPVSDHPLNIFETKTVETVSITTNGCSTQHLIINTKNIQIDDDDLGFLNSMSSVDSSSGENESDVGSNCNDSGNKSESDTEYETESSASGSEDDDDFDPHYEDVKVGRPFRAFMYFGSEQNEHFIGPAPTEEMAQQIYECVGFSGRNIDYLLNLCDSMREICDEALDSHLRELEDVVLSLREQEVMFNNSEISNSSNNVNTNYKSMRL